MFVCGLAEGFPGAEGGDGEFAAQLVVAVVVFVFLQDGELDAVDGEQFVEGQAEGEGGEGVEFDQGLATGVVGAQWAVAGPDWGAVRPGDIEAGGRRTGVATVAVGQGRVLGAGGLFVGMGQAVVGFGEGVGLTGRLGPEVGPQRGVVIGQAVEAEGAGDDLVTPGALCRECQLCRRVGAHIRFTSGADVEIEWQSITETCKQAEIFVPIEHNAECAIDITDARRDNCGYEGPLTIIGYLPPIHMSKPLIKPFLAFGAGSYPSGDAAAVFAGRAGGDVIGARQVIVGDQRAVDLAVVLVVFAAVVGRFVEGRGDVKVRPLHDPIGDRGQLLGLSLDGSVTLGIALIEKLGRGPLIRHRA